MSDVQTQILIEFARMLASGDSEGEVILTKEDLARIPEGKALCLSLSLIDHEPHLCGGGEDEK